LNFDQLKINQNEEFRYSGKAGEINSFEKIEKNLNNDLAGNMWFDMI
jgi:hypothetical protein